MNLPENYIPVLIQAAVGLGFVLLSILGTHFLGPKNSSKKKNENFECGYEIEGNARTPFSVKYFLTAILFVLLSLCCKLQRIWCRRISCDFSLCSSLFHRFFIRMEKRRFGLG